MEELSYKDETQRSDSNLNESEETNMAAAIRAVEASKKAEKRENKKLLKKLQERQFRWNIKPTKSQYDSSDDSSSS